MFHYSVNFYELFFTVFDCSAFWNVSFFELVDWSNFLAFFNWLLALFFSLSVKSVLVFY